MAFRWNDIRAMDLGDKTLVMDRQNGKWVIMERESAGPFLSLLAYDDADLSDPILAKKRGVTDSLISRGLGGEVFEPTGKLNTLILKITKACNYRCSYCYDMEPEDHPSRLDFHVARSALEEAVDLCSGRLLVILHGGEPTLFFPLIERLVLEGERLADRYGKEVRFGGMSNFSRLDRRMVEFSLQHGISWGVSLDGPPDLNDRFRILSDGGGTYRHFEMALEKFPDFVRGCGVLSTITSHNQDKLLEIARHFRDLGMPNWDWSLFQPIGRARENEEDFAFSTDRVIESWHQLFQAVEAGEFDGFGVSPIVDYLQNFVTGPGPNMCLRKSCGAARDLLSISSDGTIEACDCIDRQGPLAGLGLVQIETGDSLRRARESELAEHIRSRNVETGQCGECIWYAICGGTCLAHAKSINGISENQCRISMTAFTCIAESVAKSDALKRYWNTVVGQTKRTPTRPLVAG